jgi:hypothetical protein
VMSEDWRRVIETAGFRSRAWFVSVRIHDGPDETGTRRRWGRRQRSLSCGSRDEDPVGGRKGAAEDTGRKCRWTGGDGRVRTCWIRRSGCRTGQSDDTDSHAACGG